MYPIFAKMAFFLPQDVKRRLCLGVPYHQITVDVDSKAPTYNLPSSLPSTVQQPPPPSPSIIITPATPHFRPKQQGQNKETVTEKPRVDDIDSLQYEIKMTVC